MSKWLCIKNFFSVKEGDIIEAEYDDDEELFWYIFDGMRYYTRFHQKYFIVLSEWREQQINSIFEDD